MGLFEVERQIGQCARIVVAGAGPRIGNLVGREKGEEEGEI